MLKKLKTGSGRQIRPANVEVRIQIKPGGAELASCQCLHSIAGASSLVCSGITFKAWLNLNLLRTKFSNCTAMAPHLDTTWCYRWIARSAEPQALSGRKRRNLELRRPRLQRALSVTKALIQMAVWLVVACVCFTLAVLSLSLPPSLLRIRRRACCNGAFGQFCSRHSLARVRAEC